MNHPVRFIPSIKELQDHQQFQEIKETYHLSTQSLTRFLRDKVDTIRSSLISDPACYPYDNKEDMTAFIFRELSGEMGRMDLQSLRPVINATGTILHTNLGRARLSDEVVEQMSAIAKNYSNLEFDLEKGERGSRYAHVEQLMCHITGAEAAMVVNNNAAAVFLILRAFAKNKEVIVSRGELVEIGGSFRVSSIMEESDATLIEVGTTNKTHPSDYVDAVTDHTAMLLKVHQSNFGMFGFTSSVDRHTLIEIAKEKKLILYEDLGSGAFFDFRPFGIGNEPLVSEVISSGIDIISCSGDKLLGGPQVGIILGKKEWVSQLKKHQLARTLRIDKMTLAALHMTLKEYLSPEQLVQKNPTIRDILTDASDIKQRTREVFLAIQGMKAIQSEMINTEAQVGGGTLPDVKLPSYALAIKHRQKTAHVLAQLLRQNQPPIISRTKDDWVVLDFRTISAQELPDVMDALANFDIKY